MNNNVGACTKTVPESKISLPKNEHLPRLFTVFAKDVYVFWQSLVSCQVVHATLGLGTVSIVEKNLRTGQIYLTVVFKSGLHKFNSEVLVNKRYIKELLLPEDLLSKVLNYNEELASIQRRLQSRMRAQLHPVPENTPTNASSPRIQQRYEYYSMDNFPIDKCSFCGQWICLKPHGKLPDVMETCDISENGYSRDKHICDGNEQKLDILDFCYQGGAVDSNRRRH